MKMCPKCGTKLEVDIEINGGCYGHGEGECCYCDSKDISAEAYCPGRIILQEDKRCANGVRSAYNPCKFREPLAGLRDVSGFERWIAERL